MSELEKRVIVLEAEVKLLKDLLMSQTNVQFIGAPVLQAPEPKCGCPIIGVPHTRGPGCQDSWVTCNVMRSV